MTYHAVSPTVKTSNREFPYTTDVKSYPAHHISTVGCYYTLRGLITMLYRPAFDQSGNFTYQKMTKYELVFYQTHFQTCLVVDHKLTEIGKFSGPFKPF